MKRPTDKEILDWLDQHDGAIIHEGWGEFKHCFTGRSARDVVKELIEAEFEKLFYGGVEASTGLRLDDHVAGQDGRSA